MRIEITNEIEKAITMACPVPAGDDRNCFGKCALAIAAAGAAEVPCAPYRLFGTEELARQAVEICDDGRAVLLGNHGLVAWGESLPSAYSLACDLEFVAELQWRAAAVGRPTS